MPSAGIAISHEPRKALSVALALLRAALFVAAHVGNGPAPATEAR